MGVSINMGIVYVAPVKNKAGVHFMVNLSDHEMREISIAFYSTSTEAPFGQLIKQ
jgi:hypothetical protein